ncbi:MAG: ABC transporter ATP-binding protein [Alphaproteobacteria bacterium]|nr:ABC transporter ATP-binding protein [Alphaproteobacteria bacterium]
MIRAEGLTRHFHLGETVVALDDVSVAIAPGEFVAVTGPSGSGKSTFMNIIGCLDRPSSGKCWVDGEETSGLSSNDLAGIRNRKIGFVFQNFNLLDRLDARQNVELPLIYAGVRRQLRHQIAEAALAMVGLADRAGHRPAQLSGGQQQRVAVARALAGSPKLILADEPTGALDSRSAGELMDLFHRLNQDGRTIVIVTHDAGIASRMSRVIRFLDGKLQ